MSGTVGDGHSRRDNQSANRADRTSDYGNDGTGTPSGGPEQFDVLLQLHSRFADLQKREHDLSLTLKRSEDENRELRDRIRQLETDDGHFANRERELKDHERALDKQLTAVQQQEASLNSKRKQFENEQRQLAESRTELQRLQEQLRQQTQDRSALEAETELRAKMEREIEIERTALLQLQSTLENEKLDFQKELDKKKHEYDREMAGFNERLVEERERIREELIPEIQAELQQKMAAVDEARESIDYHRETSLEEVRRQALELDEQRGEFEQRIKIEREQLEKDLERQRYELQEEKALFQKRYRFQFDHLQQSREELEESLQIHRREEQAFRVDSRHFESQLQRRMQQVDRYLDTIRKREESIARQSRLGRQTLREQLREVHNDRDRWITAKTRWEEDQAASRAELKRQEKLMAAHAENLEERRVRLENLRLELEETHQTTLETRMAVEEAFAQLAQATGQEQARERIDSARTAISDHYTHIRQGITKQRGEIESEQKQFVKLREEFRVERDELTQWLAERDQKQRAHQSDLEQQANSIEEWQANWRQARDAWKQERIEAEGVIRDLLRQLTAAHVPGLGEDEVKLPKLHRAENSTAEFENDHARHSIVGATSLGGAHYRHDTEEYEDDHDESPRELGLAADVNVADELPSYVESESREKESFHDTDHANDAEYDDDEYEDREYVGRKDESAEYEDDYDYEDEDEVNETGEPESQESDEQDDHQYAAEIETSDAEVEDVVQLTHAPDLSHASNSIAHSFEERAEDDFEQEERLEDQREEDVHESVQYAEHQDYESDDIGNNEHDEEHSFVDHQTVDADADTDEPVSYSDEYDDGQYDSGEDQDEYLVENIADNVEPEDEESSRTNNVAETEPAANDFIEIRIDEPAPQPKHTAVARSAATAKSTALTSKYDPNDLEVVGLPLMNEPQQTSHPVDNNRPVNHSEDSDQEHASSKYPPDYDTQHRFDDNDAPPDIDDVNYYSDHPPGSHMADLHSEPYDDDGGPPNYEAFVSQEFVQRVDGVSKLNAADNEDDDPDSVDPFSDRDAA